MPESSLSPWIDALGPPPLCAKEAVGNHKDSPMGLTRCQMMGLPIHVSSGPKGQWGKGFRPGWLLIVRMLGNTFVRISIGHLCHVTFPILFTTQDMSEDPSKTHPQWAWWIAILIMLMGFLAAPNSCAKFLAGGIYSLYQLVQILCFNGIISTLTKVDASENRQSEKTWHSSLVLAY